MSTRVYLKACQDPERSRSRAPPCGPINYVIAHARLRTVHERRLVQSNLNE
jgi:hypothetical protein